MRHFLLRFFFLALCVCTGATVLHAQVPDTTRPTSVDPNLLGVGEGRPKEYTIQSIRVTGLMQLDSTVVLSISGLQPGDKVMIPGSDVFSKAIQNLWRQRLFSNVAIYITSVQDDRISLELNVQERARLSNFSFVGIRKSEADDLREKIGLSKSTIITENTRRNSVEVIRKYFADKGYQNVKIRLEEKADPVLPNSNVITYIVDKGQKVKVNSVNFYGNEAATDLRLKKVMKDTKEMSKFDLNPVTVPGKFGTNEKIPFKDYVKDWGFLSLTKTKAVLDPYIRIKLFSNAKFDERKYHEDLDKVLDYYNSLGYRDARIVDTALTRLPDGNVNIEVKVDEGRRYHFGNITFRGNTKYSDSLLQSIVQIRKGDVYNLELLQKRLGKQMAADGGADISALYMDDGYLFFRADPVETSIYNDTIDHEIRIVEGPQATIRNVNIYGNDKTKDYVIRRELRTVPGEKFSRSDLIRSSRELAQLQYFNQEKINPGVNPNQEDGTVDINWQLEEKSSDQLELSAGWGGGIGLTGTLGVTFNNFSIKNILKRSTWDPLPSGDGQKLSIRVQSNGAAYRSYNFSFTEPWLGGKKRNPFTVSFYNSKFANLYDSLGGYNKGLGSEQYLRTIGVGVSLGKQLKWPDDYFSLLYSLNYTQYKLKNYAYSGFGFTNGTANNISFKIALQRSSVFDPQYPTGGSNMVASVQFTPPYSWFDKSITTSANPYKNPEYHKWRFTSEWFVPIGRPGGADKNRQLVLKVAAKYGFMGRYNSNLDFSPFERFQLGGDGLTNSYGILGYDVISLRGYPVFDRPDPSINPDLSQASTYFTIFNKYQLELRYPLVRNQSSTIYGLAFFDAANGWRDFKEYNPFRLRRSVGVGMRFFLPMFGMLGFDYGVGLDRLNPADRSLKNASRFTFMLGFEPE
jgi:outer membrane protein insertion porin family